MLSPVLTNEDGSLLGVRYCGGLPSLLAAWSLIGIEGGRESRGERSGVKYYVNRKHERIRKDGERL